MRLPRIPPTKGKLPPETYDFMVDTRNYLQALTPVQSLNVLTSFTAKGVSREGVPKSKTAAPGNVSQYRVHTVGNDYLVCQKIDGSTVSADLVYIAKPFHLRRTPFDNQNVTYTIESPAGNYTVTIHYVYSSGTFRSASIGGQSESQTVIPRFALDRDIIYAAEVEEDIAILDANGGSITLIDLNADGRAWAKVL